MKKLLLAIAVLPLVGFGCKTTQEKNDEAIAEYKKCIEAGMETTHNTIGEVFCRIPESQE